MVILKQKSVAFEDLLVKIGSSTAALNKDRLCYSNFPGRIS
jgi:hypothetical protein